MRERRETQRSLAKLGAYTHAHTHKHNLIYTQCKLLTYIHTKTTFVCIFRCFVPLFVQTWYCCGTGSVGDIHWNRYTQKSTHKTYAKHKCSTHNTHTKHTRNTHKTHTKLGANVYNPHLSRYLGAMLKLRAPPTMGKNDLIGTVFVWFLCVCFVCVCCVCVLYYIQTYIHK